MTGDRKPGRAECLAAARSMARVLMLNVKSGVLSEAAIPDAVGNDWIRDTANRYHVSCRRFGGFYRIQPLNSATATKTEEE